MFSIPNISQLTTCASQFFKSKISYPQGRIAAIAFPIIVILGTIAYRMWKNRSSKRSNSPLNNNSTSPIIPEKSRILDKNKRPYKFQPENPQIFQQIDAINQSLQSLIEKMNVKTSQESKKEGYNIFYCLQLQAIVIDLLSKIGMLAELAYEEISKLKEKHPQDLNGKSDLEIAKKSEYINDFFLIYLNFYQSFRWLYVGKVGTSCHFSENPISLKFKKPKTMPDSLIDHQKLYYQENTIHSKMRSEYNKRMEKFTDAPLDTKPPLEDPRKFQVEWNQLELSNVYYLCPIALAKPVSSGK